MVSAFLACATGLAGGGVMGAAEGAGGCAATGGLASCCACTCGPAGAGGAAGGGGVCCTCCTCAMPGPCAIMCDGCPGEVLYICAMPYGPCGTPYVGYIGGPMLPNATAGNCMTCGPCACMDMGCPGCWCGTNPPIGPPG